MGQNNRCGKVVVNIPEIIFYNGQGKWGKYLEQKDNLNRGGEGKWRKYLKKIFFLQRWENEQGKCGKYLKKGNIFFAEEKKIEERERVENIWRRVISFFWGEEKQGRKKEENILRRNNFFV